jgi:hypothetical protein
MFVSPVTSPYSATEALGKTSMAEHSSPTVAQVRQVLSGEQVVSTALQKPSEESEEHAKYDLGTQNANDAR